MNITVINRLNQQLEITVRNLETNAYEPVKLTPLGTYGPVDQARVSPYVDQLARRGHVQVREA